MGFKKFMKSLYKESFGARNSMNRERKVLKPSVFYDGLGLQPVFLVKAVLVAAFLKELIGKLVYLLPNLLVIFGPLPAGIPLLGVCDLGHGLLLGSLNSFLQN